MDELRTDTVADRRLTLLGDSQVGFSIRLEVWAEGEWHDISLRADRRLSLAAAQKRYAERVAEAEEHALHGVVVPRAREARR